MLTRRAISIFVLSIAMSLMWIKTHASPAPAPGKHFLIETEDATSNEDRHKLEDLRDIAEEKGLSESQEEEAKHLVESNPDLIRNSEEEEAARALFQGKGKGNDYCGNTCGGNCFGYESLVTTGSGEQKLMRDLKIGDEVVSDQTGALTEFVGWIQLERNGRVKFLEIKTDDGEELTLTGTHIVFYYEDGKPTPTYARNLSPGNVLVGGTGEEKVITSMRSVEKIGALDPLTQSGTIVTNNITASCYASFPHHLVDLVILPAKMFPSLLLDNEESQYEEGTRTYVRFFKWFARSLGIGIKKEDAKESGTGVDIYLCSFAAVVLAAFNRKKKTVKMV